MNVGEITVSEILDSRGEKTIEVSVERNGQLYSTKLPSGKSRGKREAVSLGARHALEVLEGGLKKEILSRDISSVSDLDHFLVDYDGTENKSKIGGDLSLGLSISFARALAGERGIELFELLKDEYFGAASSGRVPKIFSNMINGGAHAENNLDIQEYHVVGEIHNSVYETIREIKNLYTKLGELLTRNYGKEKMRLGDEEGYAPDFTNNKEPLEFLTEIVSASESKGAFTLGLDAAASSFYKDGSYNFERENLNKEKLMGVYKKYFDDISLLQSIEDPFAEDDDSGFAEMFKEYGREKLLIGDDLTTTNQNAIKKFAEKLINGVIIKPNQIGTVTETCEAMLTAGNLGIKRIISHRSGEVEDPFIIHFAKAGGAEGVKIGVPVKRERIIKFDELTRLYS